MKLSKKFHFLPTSNKKKRKQIASSFFLLSFIRSLNQELSLTISYKEFVPQTPY